MAHIIRPDARYHRSYLEAMDEMTAAGEVYESHQVPGDGAWHLPADEGYDGLSFTRESLEDPAEFRALVRARRADELEETPRPAGWVPCTYLWFIEGDTYLGSISLRHRLTEELHTHGGHIGYSIRPSARRQGHASEALAQTLELAAEIGLDRVLLTTTADNPGSVAVIEHNGGTLDAEDTSGGMLHYWITVPEVPRQA